MRAVHLPLTPSTGTFGFASLCDEVPDNIPSAPPTIVQLVVGRAPASDLVARIRALHLGHAPSKETWLGTVGAVGAIASSDLDWMAEADRARLLGCVLTFIQDA